MSPNKSKRYSAEFKAEAIKRAREVGVQQVCQELGVSCVAVRVSRKSGSHHIALVGLYRVVRTPL